MTPKRSSYLTSFLLTGFLVLSIGKRVNAEYDEDFCEKKTKDGNDTDIEPDFLDDYSVISETTFFRLLYKQKAMVNHQTMHYSSTNKQVVVFEDTPEDSFWVLLDQSSNDCVYRKNSDGCVSEEGDCTETEQIVGFGKRKNGGIDLGSASERMSYPTPTTIRKAVTFGESQARNLQTIKIGFCSYNPDTRETVASFFHLFDPSKYAKMDQSKRTVVAALVYTKQKADRYPVFKRIDFADLKPLSGSQITNRFGLGESRCGTLKNKFTSKEPPKPRDSFNYISQNFVTNTDSFRAVSTQTSETEISMRSQLNSIASATPVQDQNEKNKHMEVQDFNAKMFFSFSVTRGDCEVKPLQANEADQGSPKHYWGLDLPNPTYLGVYENRGIPCDLWEFDFQNTEDPVTSAHIYAATHQWLESQNKPADMFFPVERILKVDNRFANFEEIYGFKNTPGDHIPSLPTCFQEDDVIIGLLTLLLNYDVAVGLDRSYFQSQFRNFIMSTAGIKSPLRIGIIFQLQNPSAPQTETNVAFRIFGKYKGFDDLDDDVYKPDPVTSTEAVEKIKHHVDQEGAKLTLDSQGLEVKVKRGSFAVLSPDDLLRLTGSRDGPSGYSDGAMAGVAAALLVISITLGVAIVFGYKRWTEGGGAGSSGMGMKTLEEEKA